MSFRAHNSVTRHAKMSHILEKSRERTSSQLTWWSPFYIPGTERGLALANPLLTCRRWDCCPHLKRRKLTSEGKCFIQEHQVRGATGSFGLQVKFILLGCFFKSVTENLPTRVFLGPRCCLGKTQWSKDRGAGHPRVDRQGE